MLKLTAALLFIFTIPSPADSYVVCDNGLRCVMAPCPSYNALHLETGNVGRLTLLDLTALSPRDRDALSNDMGNGSRVLEGTVNRSKSDKNRLPDVALVVAGTSRPATRHEHNLCRRNR